VQRMLAALDADLEVTKGEPAGFTVVVTGAHGPVTLP
jgi:hypothetical protein